MYAVLSSKTPEWNRLFELRWQAEDYIQELFLEDAQIVSVPVFWGSALVASSKQATRDPAAEDRFKNLYFSLV